MKTKIIFLFIFGGILSFGVYGYANTLTTTGINEIQTLEMISSHPENLEDIQLLEQGGTGVVNKVKLSFTGGNAFWKNRSVTVDLRDDNGVLIGTGTLVVKKATPTITLSDTISVAERPTLREITVTS